MTKSSAPIAVTPYDFEWPVDQHGYEIEHVPAAVGSTLLSLPAAARDVIRRRSGPLRFYRPMEQPGLWRRFAETCSSLDGVRDFVSEFGLLDGGTTDQPRVQESVEPILGTAHLL